MKSFKVLMILCGVLIAGCAVPLGEDYLITRDGAVGSAHITDYNLQNYVPVPKPDERPVFLVNDRGDLEMSVVWKDENGTEAAIDTFAAHTVYKAEITITPKPGYSFYSTPFAYPSGKVRAQIDDLGDPVRTVTVTYNNSDDWNITFITDYNLQNYVPIPLATERLVREVDTRADMRVQATWQEKTSTGFADILLDPFAFALGGIYKADIRLTAKEGYRFIEGEKFTYPDGPEPSLPLIDDSSTTRRFVVIYLPTMSPTVISDLNLTAYIPNPIGGSAPVVSFAGTQYTGTVSWKITNTQAVLTGPFQSGTAYTAELILKPSAMYTLTGVGSNAFIHTGAETIANLAGSGSVTIIFPPSAEAGSPTVVYDTNLTGYLPKPVNGVTPVTGITGAQYSGTVAWSPAHSTFQLGQAYTASLALNAAPGFTFTGVGQNVFSHNDAPGTVTNSANSGTVTIVFPAARPPSNSVLSFGPPDNEDSALALLKERSAASNQVVIDLPAGSEDVAYSATLLPYATSPALVVIDGHGRTLKKTSLGSLITVGGGVILTLQNITLEGPGPNTENNAPLITVLSGGKLILGTNAVLSGNETSSTAGGVAVNGGTLIMNPGSVIKKMKALRAGGILISGNGMVIMSGGTIGGTDPNDGNSVSAYYSGGGVLINGGSFNMYGGSILSNKAEGSSFSECAGGVALVHFPGVGGMIKSEFTFNGGTIKGNTAAGEHSGGGVGAFGTAGSSITISGTAVIEGNTVTRASSGGGVCINQNLSTLTIEGGTITGNIARGSDSGGGVYNNGQYFSLYGGTITGNTAQESNSGGGIYIDNGTATEPFNILGGTITGNTAQGPNSGGGIYSKGRTQINGPAVTIEGNIAKGASSGGGIYIDNGTTEADPFNILAGTIKGNSAEGASSGGGIYVREYAFAKMGTGAVIKGNTATGSNSGGAVYIHYIHITSTTQRGVFEMTGGTIGGTGSGDGNTAAEGANGVYATGQFKLTGGVITGNTEGTNKYGVYVAGHDVNRLDNFMISAGGKVDPGAASAGYPGNVVFLKYYAANAYFLIKVGGELSIGSSIVANIYTDPPPTPDVHLLYSFQDDWITGQNARFLVNGVLHKISGGTTNNNIDWYGDYQ
ncbi:right-handed parallel beta-helix repeat-containing protein [Treponema sp. TIM-1]|uniref:beta strand repeat-containing protein n=1 Tax=Treponema sp. TIM-1 TaxID=2898417 RepID=UPI0039804CD3